jgi:hypothetical protein
MATWSKEETLKLIEIWGDDRIQAQLEGVHRNQDVFNKIAREMGESGFDRTFQQCRDKLKKLKSEYRKLKDKQGKTGEGKRKDWDYFDAMDAILGTKPATQPPVIVDTLQDTSDIQADVSGPDCDEIAAELGSNVSASEESSVPKSTPSPSPAAMKRSRKRKEKADNSVAEMLQKVTEYQCATEQKLLELEEKRFKLEEKQMEREAQLRREEREFQLRMMEMLVRRPTFYPNQPSMPYQASPPVPFPFGNSSTIHPQADFYEDEKQ